MDFESLASIIRVGLGVDLGDWESCSEPAPTMLRSGLEETTLIPNTLTVFKCGKTQNLKNYNENLAPKM